MLNRNKVKKAKGFLSIASTNNKAPYCQKDRTPDMFLFGEDSSFITPKTEEERNLCPRGIKR